MLRDFTNKIKNVVEDVVSEWGIMVIVILLGVASFGLGRLSALEEGKPSVTVREAAAVAASTMVQGGLVVASRAGSAYHYPWCSGASTIKESNKVWFKDEAAARHAGYTPAKNCKGLR